MCHDLWGSKGCDMLACPALHSLLKLEETQGMATHRWYQSMHQASHVSSEPVAASV